MKAVAIVSGGMDSVTLVYYLKSLGMDLHLLCFNYGQRHVKELQYAKLCAQTLNIEYDIVGMGQLGVLLKGSALTDNIDVPEGHYENENMKTTVVPNRNAIMLSIAYGVAVAEKANFVATGVHSGDHTIYPDCRSEFIDAFNLASQIATDTKIEILAPFVHFTKIEIIKLGTNLGVNYSDTWSCYKGLVHHCGKCGTCVERKEAFMLAKIEDPTIYKGEK